MAELFAACPLACNVRPNNQCDKDGNGKIDRRELEGLLASICVQGVETAADEEHIISQAAGGVTTVEDLKDKDGEPVTDIDAKDEDGAFMTMPRHYQNCFVATTSGSACCSSRSATATAFR